MPTSPNNASARRPRRPCISPLPFFERRLLDDATAAPYACPRPEWLSTGARLVTRRPGRGGRSAWLGSRPDEHLRSPPPRRAVAGRVMSDSARIAGEVEARLAPLAVEANLSWWDSQVEATEENAERRARAELAWSDALADRAVFASVEDARRNGSGGEVRRRLELLHDAMLRHQVPDALRARIVELETSVDLRFSRHRGLVGGEEVGDTEIKRILRRSDDPLERREAWEASKTVGAEVAEYVRELARLRNEAARSLGHRDWFTLSLSTDELDETRLAETLGACDRATAEPFARWKDALDERLATRFACAAADLRPWHYADPFFQEAPPDAAVDLDPYFEGTDVVELARRTLEGLGLEVEAILARSDLYPRDGKNQHAFCIDVDRRGDVRVLA